MTSVNSFGIDFIARALKHDKATVGSYARVTVNGATKEISLKTLIDKNDWNSGRETVIGKQIEVKAINEHINNVRFRLKEH